MQRSYSDVPQQTNLRWRICVDDDDSAVSNLDIH